MSIILKKSRFSQEWFLRNGAVYNSALPCANNEKFAGLPQLYEMCAL